VSNSNVITLAQPGAFTDFLTEILRTGARALLTQAVEAEVCRVSGKACRSEDRDGPAARRAPRPSSGTRNHDRHRASRRSPAAGARPRRCRGRAYPVLALDRAAVRAAIEEPRGADPYPLPEGHLNRRLRGSAGGPRRQGRARSIGVDHRPPQEPALAKAGEVWTEEHARWQKRDLSAKRYVYC
jgi:putative transposase